MAPTQNSTLIQADEDSTERESSLEAAEKELSQYSPILGRSKPPASPLPRHYAKNVVKSTFKLDCESNSSSSGGGGHKRRFNTNGVSYLNEFSIPSLVVQAESI